MNYYHTTVLFRLLFLLFLFNTATGCHDSPVVQTKTQNSQNIQKLSPSSLLVLEKAFQEGTIRKNLETSAWKLFDRSVSQSFSENLKEGDEVLLEVQFASLVRLESIKVYSSPMFLLTLEHIDGQEVEGFIEKDLSALPEKSWFSTLRLHSPLYTQTVRFRLTALSKDASFPELEFWGLPNTNSSLDSRMHHIDTNILSNFQMISAIPGKLILASQDTTSNPKNESDNLLSEVDMQKNVSCRAVEFFLEQDPAMYQSAYLSYESNVFRSWILKKSLNGSPFIGGHQSLPSTESLHSFAEPLDISRLSLGKNTLLFCLPKEFSGQVRVENLQLVFEKDTGQNSIEHILLETSNEKQQELDTILLDQNDTTTAQIASDDTLTLALERLVSPDSLHFSLHTPSALQSLNCLSSEKTPSSLLSKEQIGQTLFSGENTVKLSKQSVCRSIEMQFQKETSLQEILLTGSGAKEPVDWPKLQISSPLEHFGDSAILQGFALAPSRLKGPIRISIDGNPLKSVSGVFDEVLTRDKNLDKPWTVTLEAIFPDGSEFTQEIILTKDARNEREALLSGQGDTLSAPSPLAKKYGKPGESVVESISPETENNINLGTDVSLHIPKGTQALLQGFSEGVGALPPVSITHLTQPSVPKMSPWLINVTAPAGHAYEFLPHGIEFSTPVHVNVPFDPSLLPKGTSVEDIKTYYYDETTKKWEELTKVGIDVSTKSIQSKTTHFTIMANGVLAMPETPSVSSVAPNSLSSLSAANPLANVDLISPPSANSSGDANVSFPIWSPPGRGKYSPSVGLQYSSGSGNGFVGIGWNLPVSRIEIDTRFGVPDYEKPKTHRYLLDGQPLVPAALEPGAPMCTTGTTFRYRPRVEGAFLYILRCEQGARSNPLFHEFWELRDTSGTLYTYGKEGSFLADYTNDNHIFAWYLQSVEDVHSNTTTFAYKIDKKSFNLGFSTEDWRQVYPESISYTSNSAKNTTSSYEIAFSYDEIFSSASMQKSEDLAYRPDQTVTGRPGFKVLTRFLLRSIQVKFQSRVLREYVLQYEIGQFQKSLLKAIQVFGEEGCSPSSTLSAFVAPNCTKTGEEFYTHTLSYFQEELGFEEPVLWETPNPSHHGEPPLAALTKSNNLSVNGHLYLGLAALFPSKKYGGGVRGSLSGGFRKEQVGFYDINGDGLPDQVFQDSNGLSAIYNQFVPPSNTSLVKDCQPGSPDNPCQLSSQTPKGDPLYEKNRPTVPIECVDPSKCGEDTPLKMGKDNHHSWTLGAQLFITPLKGGVSLAHSVTKGKEFLRDVNGDGFLDKVFDDGVLTSHRCEPGNPGETTQEGVCFGGQSFASLQTVNLAEDTDLDEMEAEIKEKVRPQDAVRKWKAPVAGKVRVQAFVQKEHEDNSGSDGVLVELFHNDTDLFAGTQGVLPDPPNPFTSSAHHPYALEIEADDTTLHSLTAPGGDLYDIEEGEEIYLKVSSHQEDPMPDRVPLDAVDTELIITYEETCFYNMFHTRVCTAVSPEDHLQTDPTGLPIHTFNSIDDFRLAGLSPSTITVPLKSRLRIFGEIHKEETADDIRVCAQRFQSDPTLPNGQQMLLDLPCNASESYYELQGSIETLSASQATPLPFDITTGYFEAGDLLVLRIESDFSFDPERVLPFLQVEYETICPPNGSCEVPTQEAQTFLSPSLKDLQAFYPIPFHGSYGLSKGFLVPNSGMMSIGGEVVVSGEVTVAIRSPNRLIYKEYLSSGTVQIAIPPFSVDENETIMVEILKDFESTSVSYLLDAELVDNTPLNLTTMHGLSSHVIYQKYPNVETSDVDFFQGGYRNWYYGSFSGKTLFLPSLFGKDIWLQHYLQQALTTQGIRDSIESTMDELPGSQNPNTLPFILEFLDVYAPMRVAQAGSPLNLGEPSFISVDQSAFISATQMKGNRLGGYVFDPREAPEPGTPEFESFTREDVDLNSAFIRTGFTRHSVARTYTGSLGVDLGVGGSGLPNLSANGNWGAIKQKVDTIDFNGDGILDVLTPDGWVLGRLNDKPPSAPKPLNLSQDYLSKSRTLGGAFGLGINAVLQKTSAGGHNKSSTTKMPSDKSLGVGGGVALTRTRLVEDLRDINGDGLPDWVRYTPQSDGVKVRLNLGNRFGEEESFSAASWQSAVDGVPLNVLDESGDPTIGPTAPEVLRHDTNLSLSGSVSFLDHFGEIDKYADADADGEWGLEFGFESSSSRTTADLLDVNADGLPDLIFRGKKLAGGCHDTQVQLNLGTHFAVPESWTTPSWDTDGSCQNALLQPPINPLDFLWGSVLDNVINAVVSPDVLSGTGRYTLTPQGVTLGGYVTLNLWIFPFPFYIQINPGASAGFTVDAYELALLDIDGNGSADHVLRSQEHEFRDGGTLFVKHNKITGKSNLLQKISGPVGSEITLDYSRTINTVDLPQSRYVLSKVVLDDGVDLSGFASPNLETSYQYQNGYFDRREKEFFGFEFVTSTRPDGAHSKRKFENKDFWKKGLPLEETAKSASGEVLSKTVYSYKTRIIVGTGGETPDTNCVSHAQDVLLSEKACNVVFPFLLDNTTTVYENGGSKSSRGISGTLALNGSTVEPSYDEYGNLTQSIEQPDLEDPSQDIYASVLYQNDTSRWILGLATQITVQEGGPSGNFLRTRYGLYDSIGNLTSLSTQTGSSIDASFGAGISHSIFNYTDYGLLKDVTFPKPNAVEEAHNISYQYDTVTNQYATQITDGFGLSSTTSYDLGFGLPLAVTDANGNSLHREYDSFGRLINVRGPYDGIPSPALRMQYFLDATPYPFAKTFHQPHKANGQPSGNLLETVTVTDGLGKVLELSKTAVVEGDLGMTVQGPSSYDQLGRTIANYQPFFLDGASGGLLPNGQSLQTTVSTIPLYDERDRVVQVTYPDGSTEHTSYALGIPPNAASSVLRFKQVHTDPKGNVKESYKDAKGQLVSYIEYPDGVTPSRTLYHYSVLGELLSIQDPGNNVSSFTYDQRGLQTSISNPDTGLHTLVYDLAGNLRERIEPNHVAGGFPNGIQYVYDKGRLLSIDYPSKPSVFYKYGAASAPIGQRGRLLSVQDETGSQEYFYGNMGEILETIRTVTFAGEPIQEDISFHTKAEFDSFGRQLSLTYPDGEKVAYQYDAGGNLTSVAGLQTYIADMQYNEFGQKTKVVYGNGLESTFSYDPLMRRLSTKKTYQPSTNIYLQDLTYQYDLNGNPSELHSLLPDPPPNQGRPGPGSWNYSYDGVDRLINAEADHTLNAVESTYFTQSFQYDELHNLKNKTRTHAKIRNGSETFPLETNVDLNYIYGGPRPHAPTNVGHTTLSYDASGNILQFHNTQTGELKDLIWDDDGRLIQSGTQFGIVRNYYDGTGLRVLKRSEGGGDSVFVNAYFDLKLVEGNDPLGTKHIYADGMRVCSTFQGEYDLNSTASVPPQSSGNSYYFLGDHLGSSNLLTRDDGTVHEHYEYFPDGEIWIEQKPTIEIENGYLFTGKFLDEETGFYDFGQRFYDPKTGIWLSTDPLFSDTPGIVVGRPLVMSLYAYGAHSPIRYIDPDGRDVTPYHQGSGTEQVHASEIAIMSRLGMCKNFCVTYQEQFGIDGPSEAEMLLDTVILIDEVSTVFGIPGLAKGLLKAGGKFAVKRVLKHQARKKNLRRELAIGGIDPSNDIVKSSVKSLAKKRKDRILAGFSNLGSVSPDETLTIVAHGNEIKSVSAKQFAALLKSNGFNAKDIELIACRSGCDLWAKDLAKELGVDVKAALGNVKVINGIPRVRPYGERYYLPPGKGWIKWKPNGDLEIIK